MSTTSMQVGDRLALLTGERPSVNARIAKHLKIAHVIGTATRGGRRDREPHLDPAEVVALGLACLLAPAPHTNAAPRIWEVLSLRSESSSATFGDDLIEALLDGADIGELVIGIARGKTYARLDGRLYGPAPTSAVRHVTVLGREAITLLAELVQAAED